MIFSRENRQDNRRLDELPRRDLKLLRSTLLRNSAKEWWYTPDASFRLPPRDSGRLLGHWRKLNLCEQGTAERAIEFFTQLAFPVLGDSKALSVECADDEARGWVESFFDNQRPEAFRHAYSVMRWLKWVVQDLMCEPVAVREVRWHQDGSFDTVPLLPRGVETVPGGSYRVYPPEAYRWYQDHLSAQAYELSEDQILIFRRPPILGDVVPVLRSLPHLFDGRLEDTRMLNTLAARTFEEDQTIRAQVARLRPFSLPSRGLSNSRAVRTLHASLLELTNLFDMTAGIVGLGEHGEYAPVTENYLAWQHREVLRVAAAVRVELVEALAEVLFRRSATRAGFEAPGLRIWPRGAPSTKDFDDAFDDYSAGRVDIFAYHERTRWR